MAKNVMILRVVIEGLAEDIVHEREVNVEIPTEIIGSAISIDADLMVRKFKQEVAAKLREVAEQIERE